MESTPTHLYHPDWEGKRGRQEETENKQKIEREAKAEEENRRGMEERYKIGKRRFSVTEQIHKCKYTKNESKNQRPGVKK